ncbi:MAG: tRNA (adenosine(37)-N6)-threonylcarbamoyltransferase complex dimerization subunit type 1 TsaB [Deltaproteobacteria bacterium]|nr:tRNA (adenosine(37)-N6)-threonylcarbamoyltransferase complex dimerization subunit type 1 TsaB [Deltaproteobacteria bacterium]MBI4373614.1 tRNA (adenosine(37)-N6)-threonylcarbamoyltransferase complex dimerization subunit type 1 TsaB [Deltaproteobacteria bacterium]
MKILAIDTSTLTGSVALLETQEAGARQAAPLLTLRAEVILSVSTKHSQSLMPAIERIVTENLIGAGEIDLFAVSEGPGSFTGLRIGMATVQGLALAAEKPSVGVSSLMALALSGSFFPGLVVPMLDARRGEVYAAALRLENSLLPHFEKGGLGGFVIEEAAIIPDDLLVRLSQISSEGPILFLGQGAEVYRDLIASRLGERAQFAPAGFNLPRASHVGYLAWQKFLKEGNDSKSLTQPSYLRTASVTFPTAK